MTYLTIYHKNCTDGLGAALAVREWLKEQPRGTLENAEFMTAQYGDEPPDVAGKDVFIVDFSYPRQALIEMHEAANSLIVIDHHKTSAEALSGLDFCIFDMSKAGCVLTWKYLFPYTAPPLLFEYLQDRDLWTWKLNKSREVSAALRSYKPFFDVWQRFLTATAVVKLAEEGEAILRYQQRQIEMVLSREAPLIEVGGYRVPCINSTTLISELGNELAKGHPFAALYFDTNDGKRIFSLRSVDGGLDVSEVARQYGGGGHPRAAGFSIDRPDII